jgi:hypothetical protein
MTTNVTSNIDPAVLSRTQVHLQFPALTKPLRVRVWENFAERLPDDAGTLTPAEIDGLAAWQINGREIKNILNMSVSWCRKKEKTLSRDVIEHLLPVICPYASKADDRDAEGETTNGVARTSSDELALLDL